MHNMRILALFDSRRLVAACILLLAFVARAPTASAQTLPGPQFMPVAGMQQHASTLNHCGPAACPRCPAETYWIISLRCCPQKTPCPICPNCVDFLCCTPDGCMRRSDHGQFLASLLPRVPVCLMIHGSYVTWQDVPNDAQSTFCWLRGAAPQLPLNYVYVTWPSDPTLPPFDIQGLGRKSARNGFQLATLIQTIPCDHPVSFIGHSHGARMTLSTLHLLGGGVVQGYSLAQPPGASHRFRAVLGAAAVDHHWMNPGERYGCSMRVTECLLNFRSRHDGALSLYPFRRPFSKAALGKKGLTKKDIRKLGPLACRIAECDVTPYVKNHHFWQYYNGHPALALSAVPYVYFPDVQASQVVIPPAPVE